MRRVWSVSGFFLRNVEVNTIGRFLGGVFMRKLAPARISYRHDFLISYRVYMMTGLFHISLFEGTLLWGAKCIFII